MKPCEKKYTIYTRGGGGGGGDSIMKVGTNVRRMQNLRREKFFQKPNAQAKQCPKT